MDMSVLCPGFWGIGPISTILSYGFGLQMYDHRSHGNNNKISEVQIEMILCKSENCIAESEKN